MKPLAYRLRPKKFSEIYGQDFLVGPNGIITKMIENDSLTSTRVCHFFNSIIT